MGSASGPHWGLRPQTSGGISSPHPPFPASGSASETSLDVPSEAWNSLARHLRDSV